METNKLTKIVLKTTLVLILLAFAGCLKSEASLNPFTANICKEFNSTKCTKELNSYNFEQLILFKTKPMSKVDKKKCAAEVVKTCSDFSTNLYKCMSAQSSNICDSETEDCTNCNAFVKAFAKIIDTKQCIQDSRSYLSGCSLLTNYRMTGSVGYLSGYHSSIRNDLLSKLKFKAATKLYKSADFQNTLDGGEAFLHSLRSQKEREERKKD